MKFINRSKQFYAVGIDVFKPDLLESRKYKIHDESVQCDITSLPFKEKSFDIALCTEVLEHLDKDGGKKLIFSLENFARKQVIFTTPVGDYKQMPFGGNVFQEHKYIWLPADLKNLGYAIRGIGIRNIGGEDGMVSSFPKVLRPILDIVWVFASTLSYFIPSIAGDIVCCKRLY
jgi:hypothetical protein